MPQDSERRARLKTLIAELSVLKGREFTLVSGRKSKILFDMKKIMLDPEGANLVAEAVLDRLGGAEADFIGGLAMGAIPLVTAVSMKSQGSKPLRAFYVREKAKTHGTLNRVDGHLDDGARVILFDDVTTTGGSTMKAVAAVRERGCKVDTVVAIVDRQEGAEENLAAEGIALVALFRKEEFLDGPDTE